eukprot:IDg15805t1
MNSATASPTPRASGMDSSRRAQLMYFDRINCQKRQLMKSVFIRAGVV